MPTRRVGGRYSSPDGAHDVVAVRDRDGRWHVIDRGPTDATLVETLTGHDDRLNQAIAVARDYAEQQQAFHNGWREVDNNYAGTQSESLDPDFRRRHAAAYQAYFEHTPLRERARPTSARMILRSRHN